MYTYQRFRGGWAVFDSTGLKVDEFHTMEEAKKEVYRLNGWKYKPSNNNA